MTAWRPPLFSPSSPPGHEHGSIILTSNKGFGEWGEVLGDSIIATAILDRLLHHSHVLNIRGESFHLWEKKQAGLIGVSAAVLTGPQTDATHDNPSGVGHFRTDDNGSKVRRR